MPAMRPPHPRPAHPSIPTSTTVASALSGIFSSSFSSCLDLERVMPAGGVGVRTSLCGVRRGDGGQGPSPGHRRGWGAVAPTSRSTSTRVSCSPACPAMRGSVTAGSLPSATWLVLWWCTSREPRLPAEMFRGKENSFSSLGWLRVRARAVRGGPMAQPLPGSQGQHQPHSSGSRAWGKGAVLVPPMPTCA